jgi:hypothetical protein
MMTTDEARRYTTEEARAALRAFLSERWSLCVPPQPTDPDMILDAVITERDALLAQNAALRDHLARAEAVVEAARALALRLPPSGGCGWRTRCSWPWLTTMPPWPRARPHRARLGRWGDESNHSALRL